MKVVNVDNLGRVLAIHENIIGIYSLFDPAGNNAKAGIYNIKAVVFTFNNQAELQTILQHLCKPLDSKYSILKDILGHEWTNKTVAAWYADDEIKLGSFDAIKDDVLPIYYGPDVDTAQIAQTFQDYITSPDAH